MEYFFTISNSRLNSITFLRVAIKIKHQGQAELLQTKLQAISAHQKQS